jgi:hypothetical protein
MSPFPLKKGGWGRAEAPEDGLVFALDAEQHINRGFFVGSKELTEVGYTNFDPIIEYYMKLHKRDLQFAARNLGLKEKGNKTQIIKRILGLE